MGATHRTYTVGNTGSNVDVVENAEVCTNASDAVSVVIITGLDDIASLAGISAYPNPTTGMLSSHIFNERTGKFHYQITGMAGRIIRSGKFDKSAETH